MLGQPSSGGNDAVAPAPARARFIGFVADQASAAVLHEALAPAFPKGNELHVLNFRAALGLLSNMTTPEIVLVDLTGEVQPMNAMSDLAEVVETGTTVFVIGDVKDVNFYRSVTKGMGVREYLQKPLTKFAVQTHFLNLIQAEAQIVMEQRGGRMISVAGVRGGIGASTIAANLAWVIGSEMHRHTVLLDGDLYTGTAALTLNVKATSGLRTALKSPDRLDQLLIERAAQPAAERLHVLAASEALGDTMEYVAGGAAMLCQALRLRYNFVIADAGARQLPFARDLQYLAEQRIIVVDPSLLAIRNFGKISELPSSPKQSPKPVVVLNHAGRVGGLSQVFMEQTLGLRFNAVIPDLPRVMSKAAHFGEPAASVKGAFRDAIFKIAKVVGGNVVAEPRVEIGHRA